MLDFFRQKGLTSVVYGAVIVATILVFVLGFNPSAGKKTGSISEACAARVHGSCIDPKSHRAAFRLVFSRGTGGMRQSTASRFVLDGLIERELLVSEAERLGLTVSEDEITSSIFHGSIYVSLPSDNSPLRRQLGFDEGRIHVPLFNDPKTKQFDMKVYERAVKQLTGRSPTEFREWQGREILAAKVRDLIRAPIRVADDEAFDRYTTAKTTSVLNYVVVRRSWVEKYGITADPKEVDAWSKDKTNLAQVKVPVRHILIRAGEKPEEKEEAKKKAEGILERVKKGEDFGKLAKEFSDDPGSKDKGGQYPGEMVEQFVEPFKKAVESVKPGELVKDLVETTFGWHIIKRDDATRDDIAQAFKKARSLDISKQMAQKIAEGLKAGTPGEAAAKSVIDKFAVTRPAPAKTDKGGDAGADEGGAPAPATADTDPERPQFVTSSPFNRSGEIPGVSGEAAEAVMKFAFGSKAGEVSPEPIRTDDGFLVAQLKEQKPATHADFEKDRDDFVRELLDTKQNEALGAYVRRLKAAEKGEIKIDENNVFGAKSDAGATHEDEEDGP